MSKIGWIEEPLYSKIRQLMPLACVDILVVYEGRLLLMKRNNAPGKGEWFTPGSRIHLGEPLNEAVERTLREETGLKPVKIEQKGAMSHFWPEVHTVTIIHKVDVSNDDVTLNSEHQAYKWISAISEDLHPYVKEMIRIGCIFRT